MVSAFSSRFVLFSNVYVSGRAIAKPKDGFSYPWDTYLPIISLLTLSSSPAASASDSSLVSVSSFTDPISPSSDFDDILSGDILISPHPVNPDKHRHPAAISAKILSFRFLILSLPFFSCKCSVPSQDAAC